MDNRTKRADLHLADRLFGDLLQKAETLPFSYTIGEKTYFGMPAGSLVKKKFVDRNVVELDYFAKVDGISLRAEVLQYRDFPAAEWTVYMTREEEGDSPLVTGLNAADLHFPGNNPRLITSNGDFFSKEGYAETIHDMTQETAITMAPEGGRCCDHAFPYQRLLFDGFGLNISVGWPAQWTASYKAEGDGVSFTAGQQVIRTTVSQGETFRSPRMSLVCFEGDLHRGINMWRRWYVAHVMPRTGGEPLRSYICGHNSGGGLEFTKADQENQLSGIDEYVKNDLAINCWWLDAGWYPSKLMDGTPDWWKTTGTWEFDKERFPNGFAPMKEKLAENDIDFLLWFEVERANYGTEIFDEHPEWLLRNAKRQAVPEGTYFMDAPSELEKKIQPEYGLMLNMGNPDCVEWLSKKIAAFCIKNGVKIYRQDYNFSPLSYWRFNEAEDKQGMLENKYVQGYLAYWDYLLWNVPDLTIDSCASGGRRNDLETMRRAVPFHPTDSSYGDHPVQQSFAQTMYGWVPFFRGYPESWEEADGSYGDPEFYKAPVCGVDEFVLYHAIAPAMTICDMVNRNKDNPEGLAIIRKAIGVAMQTASVMMYSDYYALTPYHKDRFHWTVWQFDRPEENMGIFRTVRNNGAREDVCNVQPFAMEEGIWELENLCTGEKMTLSGKDIADKGIDFAQPIRSCWFWKYKKIG